MIRKFITRIASKFLTGDILAGKIRHLLTSAGGLLIGYQLASVEESTKLIDAIMDIVDKPEFWEGIVLYLTGYSGSIANKVKRK